MNRKGAGKQQESFRGDEHKLKTRKKIEYALFIHLMTLHNYRVRVAWKRTQLYYLEHQSEYNLGLRKSKYAGYTG
jgi:hypothetical protein